MTHELTLEWADGSLNLLGSNSTRHGVVEFETLAEGTDWGNPESVRRALQSLLADGSRSIFERDENRTLTIKLRLTADSPQALAGGEATLDSLDGRRCEIVWRPPDGAPAAVFVAVAVTLQHDMDDLAELRTTRYFTLAVECLPHAYSEAWTEVQALPVETISTRNTVDPCNDLAGWTATGATLTLTGTGGILVTAPDWEERSASVTVTRAGSVNFTTDRFLGLDTRMFQRPPAVEVLDGSTWTRVPHVGADGLFQLYDVGRVVGGLRLRMVPYTFMSAHPVPVSPPPGYIGPPQWRDEGRVELHTVAKQATLRTAASSSMLRAFEMPGTRRTPAYIHLSGTPTLVYAGPMVDPSVSRHAVDGPHMRTPTSPGDGSFSGGWDRVRSAGWSLAESATVAATVADYRIPLLQITRGLHALWARVRVSDPEFPSALQYRARLLHQNGFPVTAWETLGRLDIPGTDDPALQGVRMLPLGAEVLPHGIVHEHAPGLLELRLENDIVLTDLGEGDVSTQVRVDEVYACNIERGWLAVLNITPAEPNVWLDGPTLEVDHPVVWVDPGESGDRAHARPASLASEVLALSSGPRFEPGLSGIYTAGFAGYVMARGRAAWHTHPAE